jgi:hypothetical protein
VATKRYASQLHAISAVAIPKPAAA